MLELFPAALSGLLLMASLVVAVGPENAFLLRQGLTGRHVAPVAGAAILIDMLLIGLGCLGLGGLIRAHAMLLAAVSWGGAAFLVYYAQGAFRRALRPHALGPLAEEASASFGAALRVLTAVTLFNPAVLLDTVLLVGGTSARYPGLARLGYFAGASLASTLWFLLICFGARYLRRFLASPRVWRVFECANGAIMVWTAWRMVRG